MSLKGNIPTSIHWTLTNCFTKDGHLVNLESTEVSRDVLLPRKPMNFFERPSY